MEFLPDSYVLSRMQFALTAIFHMLWPVLTTGMGIYLVVVEILWLKTKNPDYYGVRVVTDQKPALSASNFCTN